MSPENTRRLDLMDERMKALESTVMELHTIRKFFGWAIPTFVAAALSFLITSAVSFYKVDQTMDDLAAHRNASAMVAHPGTADALFGLRNDLQHTRDVLEANEQSRAIRDAANEQRLERVERSIDQVLEAVRNR